VKRTCTFVKKTGTATFLSEIHGKVEIPLFPGILKHLSVEELSKVVESQAAVRTMDVGKPIRSRYAEPRLSTPTDSKNLAGVIRRDYNNSEHSEGGWKGVTDVRRNLDVSPRRDR
jgi:hypothetical protein